MSGAIAVQVDTANPGQYFACCGLLELAHRMQPGSQGWFDGGAFRVTGVGTAEWLEALRTCEIANTMPEGQKQRRKELGEMGQKALKADATLEEEKKDLDSKWRESPVKFGAPFDIQVDWFLDDRSGGNRFKTWAGQQSIIDIVTDLRHLLPSPESPPGTWLETPAIGDSVPLNFDSNLGGAGTDVDIGFSFDPLKSTGLKVGIRPVIELLAFVGLQRFRPVHQDGTYAYGVWCQPSGVELAALAACGVVRRLAQRRLQFQLLYRTKYLKSFLPGRPV